MKNLLTSAVVSLSLAACVSAGGASHDRAEFHASITRMVDDYVARANAGEWDKVVEYYEHDAAFRFAEDGSVRYLSADSIAAAFRRLSAAGLKAQVSMQLQHVRPLARDMAWVLVSYRQTLTGPTGAEVVSFHGVWSGVLRQAGGRWRILGGHSSTYRRRE